MKYKTAKPRHRTVTARDKVLFDEAIERGRQLEAPFSNFDGVDYGLIDRVLDCRERVPNQTADALLLLRGEDYASAARELRRWLAMRASRSAAA